MFHPLIVTQEMGTADRKAIGANATAKPVINKVLSPPNTTSNHLVTVSPIASSAASGGRGTSSQIRHKTTLGQWFRRVVPVATQAVKRFVGT